MKVSEERNVFPTEPLIVDSHIRAERRNKRSTKGLAGAKSQGHGGKLNNDE